MNDCTTPPEGLCPGVAIEKASLGLLAERYASALTDLATATAALRTANERIAELERELKKCGKENCFGREVDGVASWVRKERLGASEARAAALTIERDEAQMHAAIAGTETGQYWTGQDDGCRGTMGRWEQALTRPIPVPGVIGDERMEGLYRRTEGLRARATALEAALRELVAVKALKDKAERGVTVRGDAEARGMCSSFQEQSSVLAEYARRKPLAWEAAQKVLAAIDAARAALDEGERG